MKECPKCKTIFPDDMFYCLDDGTPLDAQRIENVDPTAPTEAAYNLGHAARTEVLPNAGRASPTEVLPVAGHSIPTQNVVYNESPATRSSTKPAYVVIAVLILVCVALGSALLVLNRNQIFSMQTQGNVPANDVKSTPLPSPVASRSPQSNAAVPTPTAKPPTANLTAAGKWKGEWSTTSGTLLDFELTLTETDNKAVEGQIRWTLRKTARPDKMDKIGLSATEYVHGTFDPTTGDLKMRGFNKDDPNGVLVMLDEYKLTVSPDGRSLTGLARNGGKWNGHIRLTK